ncbi:MAG: RiPP maturation radical SAM C-methyltransferase [bacterium]
MSENNHGEGQRSILLISMPFQLSLNPSIQLGTLCSYLKNKGILVDTQHAYLKCTDILGPELYYFISNVMRNEVFYPCLLFPENYRKYKKKIEDYFKRIMKHFYKQQQVSFKTILDRIRAFNEELLTGIDFSKYSLIGFSVTFDQLKASLYLAGRIKQIYPDIPIVFGGANCTEALGVSLLKTFSEIDFIVSGEGEATLTNLFMNLVDRRFDDIKGLGWRDNGTVRFNGPPEPLSLDNLPVPDYEDYFNTLEGCSSATKEYIRNYLSIPVEGSRGCWWRRCTFCNLNKQYSHYREKPVEQVIDEIGHLVDKYPCHNIQFVDNVQRVKDFNKFMSGLKNLDKDLDIFMEMRAGSLKKEDYLLMRDAGVKRVQIGVEAFGNKCLKKMNKGTTTIENIAAIKYCQEFGILPFYNIIINYPNEDESDLQETSENVKFLKGFIPPISVHPMTLAFESPVFDNPEEFNIKEKKNKVDHLWCFPGEIRETLIPFYYDYTKITEKKDRTFLWQEIFRAWQQTGEKRIFSPLLFCQDTGRFLTITDNLSEKPNKTILEGIERQLYLFCDTIKTKPDIMKQFSDLSSDQLEEILEGWIARRWMFREGERFLSLAIRKNNMTPGINLKTKSYLLQSWRPPSPYKFNLKLGPLADIGLAIDLKKKPEWLRRLKRCLLSLRQ